MTPCICCDPEGLSKTAEAYRKAASQFNQAKSAFVKTKSGNPGFGLFMAALYPAYMRCKSATQGYLGNIGQMTERLSSALEYTAEQHCNNETEIIETLKKILKEIEEQNQLRQSGIDVTVTFGAGTAGATGTSGWTAGGAASGVAGGYSGESSSQSYSSMQTGQWQTASIPVMPSQATSTAGASAVNEVSADATAHASVDVSATTDSVPTSPARNAIYSTPATTVPLPNQPDSTFASTSRNTSDAASSIDLDVDGDSNEDYSLNLKNGGTHVVVGQDGSITVSHQKTTSVPLPTNAQATQDSYLTVDANHDGVDDIMLTGQQGQDAKISVYEQGDTEYAAIDFDHDGDYDVSVRVEDTAQTYQKMREQAEQSVWESIAAKDPLGRTAEQLKALYEDRDVIELPQRSEIK